MHLWIWVIILVKNISVTMVKILKVLYELINNKAFRTDINSLFWKTLVFQHSGGANTSEGKYLCLLFQNLLQGRRSSLLSFQPGLWQELLMEDCGTHLTDLDVKFMSLGMICFSYHCLSDGVDVLLPNCKRFVILRTAK